MTLAPPKSAVKRLYRPQIPRWVLWWVGFGRFGRGLGLRGGVKAAWGPPGASSGGAFGVSRSF
jgi:hypothetical protein